MFILYYRTHFLISECVKYPSSFILHVSKLSRRSIRLLSVIVSITVLLRALKSICFFIKLRNWGNIFTKASSYILIILACKYCCVLLWKTCRPWKITGKYLEQPSMSVCTGSGGSSLLQKRLISSTTLERHDDLECWNDDD